MDYSNILDKCNLISIYLGNMCNFDCTYCDRGYIANTIGGQGLNSSDVQHISKFFREMYKESTLNVRTIAFHGGEPFLYVKRMDDIITEIEPYIKEHNLKILITTNTSLLLQNLNFVSKWAQYLRFTFSYDFSYQEENRSSVDIETICKICNEMGIEFMWQFVIPIYKENVFNFELINDIITKSKYAKHSMVNLIPLRHMRGKDKFTTFIDQIDLIKFNNQFTQFINTLYNYDVSLMIDGSYREIDKNYANKHYKIILSPDGYIYPEYDFCEYKIHDFRVGQWKSLTSSFLSTFEPIIYSNQINEDDLIDKKCQFCSVRAECGLKYLYKFFNKTPTSYACRTFYSIINNAVKYVSTLNTRKNFSEWVMGTSQKEQSYNVIADPKSYFLNVDNLYSAKQELIFSMFRRYNCFAGCEICYVDKYFEKDKNSFSRYIPDEIPTDIEDKWFKIFEGYYNITCNDDLFYLKNNHPVLFKWYQEHSNDFYFGSITDNGFVRSVDILLNDISKSRGVYEITFSDKWLYQVNIDKILLKLNKLHNKFPIVKIKFIQTVINSESWENVSEIFNFANINNIQLNTHYDVLSSDSKIIYREGQEMSYGSYNGEMHTICSEGDYLQYDSFFLSMVDAIDPDVQPYDTIYDFSFTDHIKKHLNGKKEIYERNFQKIKDSTNEININFKNYYSYVVNNLTVHDDYNFIPNVALNTNDKLYYSLLNEGWQQSNYGLFKISDNVVPLYEFKK